MFEQHIFIKQCIEVLKDNDNDEYQMYLQYKSFINESFQKYATFN